MKCTAFQRRQAEAWARQQLTSPKEAFMVDYVLARATCHPGSLSGEGTAREAAKAWAVIQAEKVKP